VKVVASKGSKPGQGGEGPVRLGAGLDTRVRVCEVGEHSAELRLLDVVHRMGKGGHESFIRSIKRSGQSQTPDCKGSLGELPPTVRRPNCRLLCEGRDPRCAMAV